MTPTAPIMTPQHLLTYWQGHRSLTRRVIEAFPEKELFEFSIGGMRPFADMAKELLAIAAPGLKELVTREVQPLNEHRTAWQSKEAILNAWDESTATINEWFPKIAPERFADIHVLFGQFEYPVIDSILYFVDNEIHHRGQGYVYLRSLGIDPPPLLGKINHQFATPALQPR